MDGQEFDRLAAATRLGDKARRMARAVLVEGVTPADAGKMHGATRQAARQAADRVLAEARAAAHMPDHWQPGTWILPPELVELVRVLASREYQRAGLQVHAKVTTPRLTPEQVADIGEVLKRWRELE